MRSWICALTIAAFVILAASPCLAHEEAVIVAGRNGAGELVADADFDQPVGLEASVFPGISGYATGELAFHSTTLDDPVTDFFQLSTAADLRFVLLAKDPGMEVWNDTGSRFMQTNEMFYAGAAPFDIHPIWNLVSGTPGQAYSLTLKLIDLNHVYRDSQPFLLSFTPGVAQTATPAADFSISANLASLTIAAGQSASTTLTIRPLNGSTQSVAVGCGALPPFVTCSFSPSASVTLNGSQPATLTLTIRTNVVAALLQRIDAPRYASAGGLLGLTWLLAGWRTRRMRHRGVLLALCLGLAACGGGGGGAGAGGSSSSSSAAAVFTPPGNYTVSVSAAAGASSHPLNLTVVVQ